MKCEDSLEIIECFFDGELDAQTAELVSAHIAGCSRCDEVFQNLQTEQELYLKGAFEVELSHNFLTVAIEKDRTKKTSTPIRNFVSGLLASFRPLSIARLSFVSVLAVCLVLVTLSASAVWFIKSFETNGPSSKNSESADTTQTNKVETPHQAVQDEKNITVVKGSEIKPRASVSPIKRNAHLAKASNRLVVLGSNKPIEITRKAEKKYLAAIALLSRDLNKRRFELDPDTVQKIEETLATVDRVIKNTRQAVRENPDDPVAAQYMLSAYSQKVEVLRELTSY